MDEQAQSKIENAVEQTAEKIGDAAERLGEGIERAARAAAPAKDIVWPLFLIFLGVILLLNTTGLISWSIWDYLWRFWPIILILGGAQLILGRAKSSNLLIGTLALVLFSFAAITSALSGNSSSTGGKSRLPTWWPVIISACGEEKTETLKIAAADFTDIKKKTVRLDISVGKFTFADAAANEDFLTLDAAYCEEHGKPDLSAEKDEDTLDISFRQENRRIFLGSLSPAPEYNFTGGQNDIPTALIIDTGAGQGQVELESAKMENVDVQIGAGELTIVFGQEALPPDLKIEVGAGRCTLTLPEEAGYELNYTVGLGSLRLNGKELTKVGGSGQSVRSDNYDTAKVKTKISVNVGVGRLEINHE